MIGIDLVDVKRLQKVSQKYGVRFFRRSFTERELEYASKKRKGFESLAGFFACKEAFMKACAKRLPFKDIEIFHSDGKPYIYFRGKIFENVSISHEGNFAIAVVYLEEAL